MTVQLDQPVKQTPPRDRVSDARPAPREGGADRVPPPEPEAEGALKAPAGAWGY